MKTPALTILELARKMREFSASALNEDLRPSGESDAVALGKLTVLDVIADGLTLHDPDMTDRERRELQAARHELGRAFDHLSASLSREPQVKQRKRRIALGITP